MFTNIKACVTSFHDPLTRRRYWLVVCDDCGIIRPESRFIGWYFFPFAIREASRHVGVWHR